MPRPLPGDVRPLSPRPRFVLFDWGDTLMSENGPAHITMADWPEVRAMEGTQELLKQLQPHHELAVCTNATISRRADIERALGRVGLARFFTAIFCYTELGHRKEEPGFWQTVLSRLGARADEALMVGDTLEPDVLAPMRCGIPAVWFNWKQAASPSVVAFPVIDRLDELPPWLGEPA